ncbi:MAG: hypothetical protein ACTSRS_16715 [Candidatus Helarchaeota archaeon]
MVPVPPPPMTPPTETPILKYRIKYDLDKQHVEVEIFYHELEKRIEGGKMSKITAVKSKKVEGQPKDLALLIDILRNEKPTLVIDYKQGSFSLKTTGDETSD